jgi:hypothetical protein
MKTIEIWQKQTIRDLTYYNKELQICIYTYDLVLYIQVY